MLTSILMSYLTIGMMGFEPMSLYQATFPIHPHSILSFLRNQESERVATKIINYPCHCQESNLNLIIFLSKIFILSHLRKKFLKNLNLIADLTLKSDELPERGLNSRPSV